MIVTKLKQNLPFLFSVILLLIIIFTTLITIFFVTQESESAIKESVQIKLISIANLTSSQIDGDTLDHIRPGDEKTQELIAMRDHLRSFKISDPDIAYLYTMRNEGDVLQFIVDADDGITDDTYSLGLPYNEYNLDMLAGFDKPTADKDFVTDQWGTTLSGYAPVRNSSGSVIGIVGVDINSTVVQNEIKYFNQTSYILGFIVLLFSLLGLIINERRRIMNEKKIRESDEKYRLLADNVHDVIWTADKALHLTYVSPSITDLRGITPKEAMEETFRDSVTPSSYEFAREYYHILDDIAKKKSPADTDLTLNLEYRCKDGSTVWSEVIITPVFDKDGIFVEFVGVNRDITRRKYAEEALQEKIKSLTTINQVAMELSSLPEDDSISLFVTKKLMEISGAVLTTFSEYSPVKEAFFPVETEFIEELEEIVKTIPEMKDIGRIYASPDSYQKILQKGVTRRETLHEISNRYFSSDLGHRIQTELGISYFIGLAFVTEGELFGVSILGMKEGKSAPPLELLESYANIVAVSLRRARAETSLHESEDRLRSFIEQMLEGVSIVDDQGRIIEWNPAQERITGISRKDAIGNFVWDLAVRTMPDTIEPEKMVLSLKKDVETTLQTGKSSRPYRFNFPIQRPDGTIATVNQLIFVINSRKGNMIGILNLDVTDHRLAEDAIKKANKKLNILNSVTFNDIQNAIFALSGFIELTKIQTDDPALTESIEREKVILEKITHSLKFAQCYRDMGVKPPKWQNVYHVVIYALSHFDTTTLQREISLEGIEIFADQLLERVFTSLVQNVIKHGVKATRIRLTYQETQGRLLLIFEDNGIGIPDEMKKGIFEREFESKKGMDLFLVREILEITGITIQETGKPGEGACFEIMVPRVAYRITKENVYG